MTEVKKQLIIWTIPTTIAWAIGGSLVMILNLFFGSHGSIFDPVFFKVTPKQLIQGVTMSLSAMTAHAQLQQQGYTLNPF